MTSLNENSSQRLVDDDHDTAPVIEGWCGCSAQQQWHGIGIGAALLLDVGRAEEGDLWLRSEVLS